MNYMPGMGELNGSDLYLNKTVKNNLFISITIMTTCNFLFAFVCLFLFLP